MHRTIRYTNSVRQHLHRLAGAIGKEGRHCIAVALRQGHRRKEQGRRAPKHAPIFHGRLVLLFADAGVVHGKFAGEVFWQSTLCSDNAVHVQNCSENVRSSERRGASTIDWLEL